MSDEAFSYVWLFVFVLDAYTIAVAVLRGHGVTATLAWLSFIIAFPGFGAAGYLLLASPSIRRTTRRKRMSSASIRHAITATVGAPAPHLPQMSASEKSLLHLAAAVTGMLPSGGNRAELLSHNMDAFDRIEEALLGAKQYIWAEYYIVQNDETGRRFLDILESKAKQGVEVRLLFDAVGSLRINAGKLESLRAAGGKVEAFLPVNPLRRRWAIHLRNHRKLIVVDGDVGFTGGMNVGDQYSGRARRRGVKRWRDTHMRVEGPAVTDLAQTFAEDWHFAADERVQVSHRPAPAAGEGAVLAIVPSGPDQEFNANHLVYLSAISLSRERCYLSSPYFIPDEATLQALITTAMRGVDVRLLLPAHSDVSLVRSAARSYYATLLKAGVRVFEYRPSMLHAKTLVTDSAWSIVGTANLDIRSFSLNFEVGALVFSSAFGQELEKRFLYDLSESSEITLNWVRGRGLLARVQQGTARLLSPLL